MERIRSPQGSKAKREKVRTKEEPGSGRVVGVGGGSRVVGVGGPCNDLTAVVTFLISARFNYTVDEEGALVLLPCSDPLSPLLPRPLRHWLFGLSSSIPRADTASRPN